MRGVVLAAALLLSAATVQAQIRLPRLPGPLQSLLPISTTKEIEIGRGIASTIAGRYRVTTDSALTLYVNLVGLTVAAEAPREGISYRFAVLETPDVNAFAAPGGYIFITRGALALIETEAELAGVLAHEVGHVNRRHVIEAIRKADVLRGVRDAAGISGDDLDRVIGHGSNVLFTGLERGDEDQADSLGVVLAAGAGYAPDGLLRFVQRLSARGAEGPLRELLATHPPPAARVDRLRRIAAALSGGAELRERYQAAMRRP